MNEQINRKNHQRRKEVRRICKGARRAKDASAIGFGFITSCKKAAF